jgi:serine/threonine-protein kinase mTOR
MGAPPGNMDEHMHLVAPLLVRLFKVELVDIRRRAIVTLTKLIPKVQVSLYSYLVRCTI